MSAFQPHAESSSNRQLDHPPQILVVDDDAAALRLLATGLTAAKFEVRTAATGEEALAMIKKHPPDLAVLDFEMPGLNGAEVCARIRSSEIVSVKELPIIMLTAHAGEADEVRCLEAGANDFVTKPVSRAVLQARIQTQLRLRTYARQLEEWRTIQEADLSSARATQRAMVPRETPETPGWKVGAYFEPLIQVGGDIYGWERLTDGRWLFWLADGTGHGAAAALVTALTAHLFSKAAEVATSPSDILAAVNRDFLRAVGGSVFMTACCAIVEDNGTIAFSSAGHPPLMIRRSNGTVEAHWPEKTILGLRPGLDLGWSTVKLERGDVALLYTDGFFSFRGPEGERFTHEIIGQVLAEGSVENETIEEVLARVRARSNGGPADDDLAAISLHCVGQT